MLPWLAFSEAVGRAPHVLIEHRNFIKKLVFPVEILPVTQALSALVTEAFALAHLSFGAGASCRGSIPADRVSLLPVLLIPQLLFTLGRRVVSLRARRLYARPRPDHQLPADAVVLGSRRSAIPKRRCQGRLARDSDKKPDLCAGRGYRVDLSRGLGSGVSLALETLAGFRRRIRAGLRVVSISSARASQTSSELIQGPSWTFRSATNNALRKQVREFAEAEIGPHVLEWDENQIFPLEVIKKCGELGFMGAIFPEELRRCGLGYIEYAIIIEELARVDPSVGLIVAAHNSLCTNHIYPRRQSRSRSSAISRSSQPASGSAAGP